MFVLLKGATKEQAFKIGNEIAEAVTATNPKPVKLKFEKVQSCSVQCEVARLAVCIEAHRMYVCVCVI
jgi:DNA polymerase elongation subunit (family B)